MSIESVGFTSREGADLLSGSFRNVARFLEGDLRQTLFAVGGGPGYTGEATELRLAREIGTTEIRFEVQGNTEIKCDETFGKTEIKCDETFGNTEIKCDETFGKTEIKCDEAFGNTEIKCPR